MPTFVDVDGVECAKLRVISPGVDRLGVRKIFNRLAKEITKEKNVSLCELCPRDNERHNCGDPCGDDNVFVPMVYVPILKMRGITDEDFD